MTAHVSYLGLMKAQRVRLPTPDVVSAPVRIENIDAFRQRRTRLYGDVKRSILRTLPKQENSLDSSAVIPEPEVIGEMYGPWRPILPLAQWQIILQEVSEKHGVSIIDIKSARRDRPSVFARHECMYRMCKETTLSLPQIGKRLGGKDHSSVMHGRDQHIKRMEAGLV